MEFDGSLPIYSQIVDLFSRRIASGEYEAGGKVAPVRELAVEMGVNPNTMQKSLAILEQNGLLRTERTSGRYITDDKSKIAELKLSLMDAEASRYAKTARELGCSRQETLEALEKVLKQEGSICR